MCLLLFRYYDKYFIVFIFSCVCNFYKKRFEIKFLDDFILLVFFYMMYDLRKEYRLIRKNKIKQKYLNYVRIQKDLFFYMYEKINYVEREERIIID